MSKQTNASTSPVSVLPLSTNVVSVRGKAQQIKETKTWKGKQRQVEQQETHDIDDVCVSGQTALKKLKIIHSSAKSIDEQGEILGGHPHTSPKWPDKAGCSVGTQLAKCKDFDGFLRFTVDGVEYCEPVMMSRPNGKTTKRSVRFV
tara:strand:+ start:640 stop:1077 length:438 start_codon:yes stop_codon:yes gene_type:complete